MMPKGLEWHQVDDAWLGYIHGELRAKITAAAREGFSVHVWPTPGVSGVTGKDTIEDAKAWAEHNAIRSTDARPVFVITVQDGMVTGIVSDGDDSRAQFVVVDHDTDGALPETTQRLGSRRVGIVEELPVTDRRYVARVLKAMEA